MNKISLVKTRFNNHVSTNTIVEFEQELISSGAQTVNESSHRIFFKIIHKLSRKSPILSHLLFAPFKIFGTKENILVILMGIVQIRKGFPHLLSKTNNKSIYLFDCWESTYHKVEKEIKACGIKNIFISAKQSAEYFKKIFPERNVVWIPEGISTHNYYFKPPKEKTIDVIQIGRKHLQYHSSIVKECEHNNIRYVYEKIPGQIIFKSDDEYYEGLAKSKISICFSSDVTNPKERGIVSTMTQRYLESMLSKCLIIGNIPHDMEHLFDYEPVVKADFENPFQQIQSILENYEDYLPLVEKNYREVLEKHLWKNRIATINETTFRK